MMSMSRFVFKAYYKSDIVIIPGPAVTARSPIVRHLTDLKASPTMETRVPR